MRLEYHPETDSLHIDLTERPSVDSHKAAPGVALDFDRSGRIAGLHVERASTVVNWKQLELADLPVQEAPTIIVSDPGVGAEGAPRGFVLDGAVYPSDQIDDYTGAAQQEGAE